MTYTYRSSLNFLQFNMSVFLSVSVSAWKRAKICRDVWTTVTYVKDLSIKLMGSVCWGTAAARITLPSCGEMGEQLRYTFTDRSVFYFQDISREAVTRILSDVKIPEYRPSQKVGFFTYGLTGFLPFKEENKPVDCFWSLIIVCGDGWDG